jgi:hypothetical protein
MLPLAETCGKVQFCKDLMTGFRVLPFPFSLILKRVAIIISTRTYRIGC